MLNKLLVSISLFAVIALLLSPNHTYAQGIPACGDGGGEVYGLTLSANTVQAGDSLTVTITQSNLNGGYYVLIGADYVGGTVQPLLSPTITVNPYGVGALTIDIPESAPSGPQVVLITSSINPLAICAGGASEIVIEGQTEQPPDDQDCRNVGESCIEGVTALCSPVTTYCDMTGGGLGGGGVVRQYGNIGSWCFFAEEQYVCANGTPSSQSPGCVCQQQELPEGSWETATLVGCFGEPGTVNTAIGCIPYDIINLTAAFFIRWGIAVGGGVALLVMAIASLQFALSQGNPQKVESAKSLFTSGIGGLAFLLLSVFLLRFIGVNVLGLFS